MTDETNDIAEYALKAMQRGFRNLLIFNFFFVIVWAVVVGLVPSGWWITLINVLCFIGTILMLWWPSYSHLKPFLGTLVGLFVSFLIWFSLVVGLRSIILDILSGSTNTMGY